MKALQRELPFYLTGLILLTLGIAITIHSRLGTSPFDALLVGLHRTVGLTIGSWEIVVGTTMILINAIALQKKPEFYAILTSLVTGIGIDSWLWILGDQLNPHSLIEQWIYLISGLIISCLGIATYLHSKLAPNPLDSSMLALSKLTGWKVSYSRAAISVVLVATAFFLSGPIGIGTLLNAIVSGAVIGFFLPYVKLMKDGLQKRARKLA